MNPTFTVRRGGWKIYKKADDVIFIINTQIGKNKSLVQWEFLQGKNRPYMTYFNSESFRAAGVDIAPT